MCPVGCELDMPALRGMAMHSLHAVAVPGSAKDRAHSETDVEGF